MKKGSKHISQVLSVKEQELQSAKHTGTFYELLKAETRLTFAYDIPERVAMRSMTSRGTG